MPDLPAYDPDGRCPKCGHDDIATTYHVGKWRAGGTMACHRVNPAIEDDTEHHDRACRRCQYRWLEDIARTAQTPPRTTLIAWLRTAAYRLSKYDHDLDNRDLAQAIQEALADA